MQLKRTSNSPRRGQRTGSPDHPYVLDSAERGCGVWFRSVAEPAWAGSRSACHLRVGFRTSGRARLGFCWRPCHPPHRHHPAPLPKHRRTPFYERKLAEVSTHKEAIRSLKRHLSDVVYRRLVANQHYRQGPGGTQKRLRSVRDRPCILTAGSSTQPPRANPEPYAPTSPRHQPRPSPRAPDTPFCSQTGLDLGHSVARAFVLGIGWSIPGAVVRERWNQKSAWRVYQGECWEVSRIGGREWHLGECARRVHRVLRKVAFADAEKPCDDVGQCWSRR